MMLGTVQVLNAKLTDGDAPLILYNMEKNSITEESVQVFLFPNTK